MKFGQHDTKTTNFRYTKSFRYRTSISYHSTCLKVEEVVGKDLFTFILLSYR